MLDFVRLFPVCTNAPLSGLSTMLLFKHFILTSASPCMVRHEQGILFGITPHGIPVNFVSRYPPPDIFVYDPYLLPLPGPNVNDLINLATVTSSLILYLILTFYSRCWCFLN